MEYLPEIYVLISAIGLSICFLVFYFYQRKDKDK